MSLLLFIYVVSALLTLFSFKIKALLYFNTFTPKSANFNSSVMRIRMNPVWNSVQGAFCLCFKTSHGAVKHVSKIGTQRVHVSTARFALETCHFGSGKVFVTKCDLLKIH